MSKALASTILVILLPVCSLAADPGIASLVSPQVLARLEAGEEITHTLWGSRIPELIPRTPAADELASELRFLDLTIGVEMLRLHNMPDTVLDSESARLVQYNILRSISSMEGIQYYSVTRDRMRTLFAESYAIDSPDTRRRIRDPLVDEIPVYGLQYMFQKDLTFGENVYRAEYIAQGTGVTLKSRNLTQMRYYFLPMVKPNDSLTVLMVLPRGRQILFYGVMAAHTPSLLGLERSREESFYNRLNALYEWFVRELSQKLGSG